MVTITSNIFINIFQTVHFSAVKFTRDNEKNNELSSDTQISDSLKKKLKQSDQAPLKRKERIIEVR